MSRIITIDPGKSKCGLVLAEISEKKVYKAIILKSELLENYLRNLITAEDIEKIIIGNGELPLNMLFSLSIPILRYNPLLGQYTQ